VATAPGLAGAKEREKISAPPPAPGPASTSEAHAAVELRPGTQLGSCRLVRVLPVERGALPFELQDPAGKTFVVEVHRRDPSVPGIRPAGEYDVFLRNGGTGRTPTDETHGLAAMALASVLRSQQAAGQPIPGELGTIVERWFKDPPPAFR
jgi:hypothetical protein